MRAASKCEVMLERAQHVFFDFGGTSTINPASRKIIKPKNINARSKQL
jgi:hypothetical protein